jgi:hypothetical protein
LRDLVAPLDLAFDAIRAAFHAALERDPAVRG